MNEVNSAEKIFLSKLQVILKKFEEIDALNKEVQEIIDNEPEKQRQLDLLLSDYYHMLENEDLSDIEILNIGKKIHETRVLRRDESRVSALIACYEQQKNKLQYSVRANRELFKQAMALKCKTLHEEYKYRVLTDTDFNSLKKNTVVKTITVEEEKQKRKRRKGITKEQLEECIESGMKTKDIAEKFQVFSTYVSNMKKKYGLNKKD